MAVAHKNIILKKLNIGEVCAINHTAPSTSQQDKGERKARTKARADENQKTSTMALARAKPSRK